MRIVTISLSEEVARWARIQAAERDTSVSRLVGEMLEEKMREEDQYKEAMEEYLARTPRSLKSEDARYPKRSELHEL